MKKYFGEYKLNLRTLAKEKRLTPEQVCANFKQINKDKPTKENTQNLMLAAAELSIMRGKGTHYFIETEELAQHLADIGRNHDVRFLEIMADEGIALGVIHTCGSTATAALFGWNQDGKMLVISDDKQTDFAYGLPLAEADEGSFGRRLLFGLCLYLNCFPGALKDGFPEFAKHPAHFRTKKCVSVGAARELAWHDGPTPHFRKGHYRVLRSEKFINKRWQVIFVQESFVGGKVKTVTEVEPKPRE